MTEDEKPNSDSWSACPGGEISNMVDRLQRGRRSAATAKMIGAATAVIFCVAAWQFSLSSENNFGQIACSDVCKHGKAYKDGSLAKSNPALLARIEEHLDECEPCATKLRPSKALSALHLPSIRLKSDGPVRTVFARISASH
jgi:hypothetical protein